MFLSLKLSQKCFNLLASHPFRTTFTKIHLDLDGVNDLKSFIDLCAWNKRCNGLLFHNGAKCSYEF